MKFLSFLLQLIWTQTKKPLVKDYKQEILVKLGREQFQTLLNRGLGVPVAFL